MNATEKKTLLTTLQARFEAHPERHEGVTWSAVAKRLEANPKKLEVLLAMEESGGEPDVIGVDPKSGVVTFCDCSKESPKGRRSLCYDRAALDARKENKPKGNAVEAAAKLGVELLDEGQYRALQALGPFDTTTSSWIVTPRPIRALGGALFGDRRYDTVFAHHNGAESYYAARGFRGRLVV